MLVSLSGIVFVHRYAARFLETRLPYLVAFSAGVFLVTAGGLALEVFELVSSWWFGALLILAGYGVAWALHALLPESHHHHDPSCHGTHGGARKLIVGDAIHNIADGIVLVAAFLASPALGVAVTVSILIHETLQEISEFFVLRQAGYSTRQALLINFAVSSTILIGVGISYLALATLELEVFLLAFSAGFFLHVVLHDLLPRRQAATSSSHFAKQIALVLCGVVLMVAVAQVTGDAHVHGGDGHDHAHDDHDAHDAHDEHHDDDVLHLDHEDEREEHHDGDHDEQHQ